MPDMKCLVCGKFCLRVLCKPCLESIPLRPSVRKVGGVSVYCFFGYDDVSLLLGAKYHVIGSRVLTLLAQKAATHFARTLAEQDQSAPSSLRGIGLVGIDDYVRSFYSHTGVLVREFAKAMGMRAHYGALQARNPISYAGKPLAYRQANKRDFRYSSTAREIVLVDDIITTGTSFKEAIAVCADSGASVHFCLALCNARI